MAERKLTRKEIAAGLDAVPLETILLGAQSGGRLTAKQKEFARNLALGKSKAQAYRESHNSKGTPKTAAANGYKLAQRTDIEQIREAYALAIEAAKHRTPAQLRELVIHRLTSLAIDGEVPPAQQIQALKLLGQVSEVAAFTERKEIHTVKHSEDIRGRLIEQLRALTHGAADAIAGEASQVSDADLAADSLLAELGAAGSESAQPDPTAPPPPKNGRVAIEKHSHTIPHSQSAPESHDKSLSSSAHDMTANCDTNEISDLGVSPVQCTGENCADDVVSWEEIEGGGVEIPPGDWDIVDGEVAPHAK